MEIKKPKFEKCVSCGKETTYLMNLPIKLREYYVEGAGQLCKECFEKTYNKK